MSGGSYNYIYSTLWNECYENMKDAEMDEMIHDLCDLLHDLEWWQSGDIGEEAYRKTLQEFKTKWFGGKREERLREYIDYQLSVTRSQLYDLIGIPRTEREAADL